MVDRFSQLNPKVLIIGDYYFYNGKKFDYSKNLSQLKRKLNNPKIINAGYPSTNQISQLSKIYSNKKYMIKNKLLVSLLNNFLITLEIIKPVKIHIETLKKL